MWTRLRVHMGCLIYITRASLEPLHRFFVVAASAPISSFAGLLFCNWIDTAPLSNSFHTEHVWWEDRRRADKNPFNGHGSWWKYEKHEFLGQSNGNLLFAACRSFRLFSFIFNWTQATDSNDSLLEHQIEVLDPADANKVHRKKRELFFFSLARFHLPAKKFQITEHYEMLHQFQTRHEHSKLRMLQECGRIFTKCQKKRSAYIWENSFQMLVLLSSSLLLRDRRRTMQNFKNLNAYWKN